MVDKEQWHLSRGVSLSHIGGTITAVAIVLMYVADIQTEVAKQGVEIKNIKVEMTKNQQSNHDMFNRIDKKLDRLFEIIHETK